MTAEDRLRLKIGELVMTIAFLESQVAALVTASERPLGEVCPGADQGHEQTQRHADDHRPPHPVERSTDADLQS